MTEPSAPARTILLVDDEANITSALKRTLRRDGYNILTANGGAEGLELLTQHEVGVIVSDQRMPQMTGVDFLRKVKVLYPKTFRIVLSGYTELESVTSAINEGAIYKFLTKPWDDDQLRNNIREAFQRYEMEQENLRLAQELKEVNEKLRLLNQGLEKQVADKTHEIIQNIHLLQISQEILEHLPVPVLGLDDEHMIAVSNKRADALFQRYAGECLMGLLANDCLPESFLQCLQHYELTGDISKNGNLLKLPCCTDMQVWITPMGEASRSKGTIVVFLPDKVD
ncbi:MAG: response regulator [Methylobacter sp.]|nr:MAG: response regulator [Methylobacter sp.]PPD19181.1 MAG: response regulator [Methylobacter sp.]